MDVGTGKTLTSLAFIAEQGYEKILVITADKAVSVWRKDILKHVDFAHVVELNNMPVKKRLDALYNARNKRLKGETLFVVVNYEAIWREPLATALMNYGFDLIITDEAQRIKSHNSKQSKFAHQLGKRSSARAALTATPFHNGPLDIFGIARFADDRIFGKSWNKFKNRYALWSGWNNFVLVKYQNLDELYTKTNEFSFTVTSDVLDLPVERVVQRDVTMPDKVRKHYKAFAKDLITEVDSGAVVADNVLVKLLRLHQLTGGWAVLDDGTEVLVDDFKGEALAELVSEFPIDEPLVIFYRFESDLKLIQSKLDRASGVINGRTNDYEAWREGKFPVLIVQVQAGGVGIDLTRSRYSIIYSRGFSLGDWQQIKGRLHRPGQTQPVTHFLLEVSDSIDTYISDAIESKSEPTFYILSKLRGYR